MIKVEEVSLWLPGGLCLAPKNGQMLGEEESSADSTATTRGALSSANFLTNQWDQWRPAE
jgi:hypothetical protein